MRFVPVKTEEQQANGIVFRARDLLVRQRTQCVNALRGHPMEYGYVFPKGIAPGNNDRFAATGMKSVTDNRLTRLIMGIPLTIEPQLV
jgi:transposase